MHSFSLTSLVLLSCSGKEEPCPDGFLRDNDGKCIEVGSDTGADVVDIEDYGELIIGETDWTDVKDLSETSQRRLLASYVGYYSMDSLGARCTTTLIAPTLIITNYHCAQSSDYYRNLQVNFGYLKESDYDSLEDLRDEGYSCTEYVLGSQDEDVALLRCPEEDNDDNIVGDDLGGYVELPLSQEITVEEDDPLYILHQNCYYDEDGCSNGDVEACCGWKEDDIYGEAIKKESPGKVSDVSIDDYTLTNGWSFDGDGAFLNNADTLKGSSGALVFSESTHTVIGLHHAGSSDIDGTPIGNKARLLSSIIVDVPDFVETIEEDIENHSTPPNLSDDDGDGYTENEGDCNDDNTAIYPGVPEYCNEYDDDCDGDVDESDAVDVSTYYADDDGDGHGNQSSTSQACSRPSGYVTNDNDCDDSDSSVYPGATERCDGEDNDCDGSTDEGVVETTYYADSDGDGYGDSSRTTEACSQPAGYATNDDDCDDSDSGVHPGATERCDNEDDDCDGTIDESTAVDATDWYADSDSDGYGDSGSSVTACDKPTGYVSDSSDCDDADATVYPGATELCDGLDNDCDGSIEPSGTFSPRFVSYTVQDRQYGVFCDDPGNDDDGNLEPGEQAEIEIELANDTCDDWFDVEGEGGATSPLSFVGSTGADYIWGTVLAEYSSDGSHAFCVAVDSSATCGTYYDIDVRVYDGSGNEEYLTLTVYVSCS